MDQRKVYKYFNTRSYSTNIKEAKICQIRIFVALSKKLLNMYMNMWNTRAKAREKASLG